MTLSPTIPSSLGHHYIWWQETHLFLRCSMFFRQSIEPDRSLLKWSTQIGAPACLNCIRVQFRPFNGPFPAPGHLPGPRRQHLLPRVRALRLRFAPEDGLVREQRWSDGNQLMIDDWWLQLCNFYDEIYIYVKINHLWNIYIYLYLYHGDD